MPDLTIVQRLADHRTFGAVPRPQLEWLVERGDLVRLAAGDVLLAAGQEIPALHVVLAGHLLIRVQRASGPRTVMEWREGDVTGNLPFSRIRTAPADVVAKVDTEVLVVPTATFRQMACDCYELTAALVHVMLDRARVFTSSDLQDEKMASLGRVAAGLAHELNNPASAVARTAKTLLNDLDDFEAACRRFSAVSLTAETAALVSRLADRFRTPSPGRTPIESADREDAVEEWFERRGLHSANAQCVAMSSVTLEDLDGLAAVLGEPESLGAALDYLSADANLRRLASDVDVSASRVHALVSAVKGFTYLDQHAAPGRVDLIRGLSDSATVLRSKARARGTTLQLELPETLPMIEGFGGELNQVWANLIDNAIDAAGSGGHVQVSADTLRDRVVIRVRDNGPGITEEVRRRMFDPFFTTKPVGAGTGLGLDIAQRIIAQHHGEIEVDSSGAGTEFRVLLPLRTGRVTE